MHSYMPEQIKSKLSESCHSPVCSPTHPYRASDGEKLFIYFKHTQTRIVPPCILFMWMETTQLLVDGAVRQREREGGGGASIGQTCLCGAIFMGPCWSSGFHVLLSLLQQGPGSEHGHWLRRKNKLKQCASLLMCLSPPHPIPSCFGARASASRATS